MKTKQSLGRTLCAAMLLLGLPAAVLADDFTWTTNNDAITITGYNGPGGDVTIPDKITDLLVTTIGYKAFFEIASLTGVTIPSGVTNIGDFAFFDTRMTNIVIPDSVISIGVEAFGFCSNLRNVSIPAGVTNIGILPFFRCTSLTAITVDPLNPAYTSLDDVMFNKGTTTLLQFPGGKTGSYTVPNGVSSIGSGAFYWCGGLTSLAIPDSVTSIGSLAFELCTSLTGVYFQGNAPGPGTDSTVFAGDPTTVYYLPGTTGWDATFDGRPTVMWILPGPFICTTNNGAITITGYTGTGGDIVIPDTITGMPVTTIGFMAFFQIASLTGVTIPSGVTNIGDFAFFDTRMTNITIPDSVTSIGVEAFGFCSNLRNVSIPAGVTNIGILPFFRCTSLTAITVDPLNPAYTSLDDVLFNKGTTTLLQFPGGKTGSYTVPNGVSSIGSGAFYWCGGLTSLAIPDSVTSIGSLAFELCPSLTGVYFQGNAPGPGTDATVFAGDNSATVYYLPETSGWGATFDGRPTVLWNPQAQTTDASFGVQTNQFGFNIAGTADIPFVVEACTNLANPVWTPLLTNTLTGGSVYFSDPDWANYPTRFYRLRSP